MRHDDKTRTTVRETIDEFSRSSHGAEYALTIVRHHKRAALPVFRLRLRGADRTGNGREKLFELTAEEAIATVADLSAAILREIELHGEHVTIELTDQIDRLKTQLAKSKREAAA